MDGPLKISVVIRTHNEIRLVRTLLQNISIQDYPNFEVIVVDSESTDGTVEAAESMGAKVVHIRDEDFTFGYSLNVGCRAATGEILVFISGHCYPADKDWLSQLAKPYMDKQVGLVYGMQRGNNTTKFSESIIFNQYFPDSSGITVSPTVFCNNANNSIRKSIWEDILFDESFTGLEDLDLSIRLHHMGYYAVYNPKAKIIHVHDETWSKVRNRFRREAFAMKQMFPQRKMGYLEWVNLFLRSTFSDIFLAFTSGKAPIIEIMSYRFNQYLGAYQGFKMEEELNLPKRVKDEWKPRESLTYQVGLSNKNRKFYKDTALIMMLILVIGSVSLLLLPLIGFSQFTSGSTLIIISFISWLSLTERPKETIEIEDLYDYLLM